MNNAHFTYLHDVLNNLDVGVFLLDNNETVVLWNAWVERHSSISTEYAMGKSFQDLFPKMIDSRVHEAIRAALKFQYPAIVSHALNKTLFPFYSYSKKNKTQIHQVIRLTPLGRNSEKTHCLVEITDATAAAEREKALERQVAKRKQSECQLRDRERALLKSNEELECFAFSVSHDLQEPLRKVQAFGDRLILRYEKILDEQGRDYIRRMQSASNRMSKLIDDLLMFSRVNTRGNGFEKTDLNVIFKEVLSDLDISIKETDASIDLQRLPKVVADPSQMRQMFQNLVSNALKFRNPNKPLRIKVSAEILDLESKLHDHQCPVCRIFVEDNGIGFEPEYSERIFQVFQRLHGRGVYEGNGIGLAICNQIARRHGGSLKACGRPGEGATFILTMKMGNQCL